MHRRSEALVLLTLAAIAGGLGVLAQTYAASSNNTSTAPNDSIALYALDISNTQSNSTCPQPPLRMASQSGTPPWMANLTDEQQQTLNETVKNLQASGATREQIRTAVNELLTQWGINIPQQTDTPRPEPPWMANLTDEQKQTLQDTVEKMKASGATPEQIRNAVDELLMQWGVEIPQCQ